MFYYRFYIFFAKNLYIKKTFEEFSEEENLGFWQAKESMKNEASFLYKFLWTQ